MHAEIELTRKQAERDLREGLEAENQLIKDYLEDYAFRGDGGDHTPDEFEQLLLIDALAGLIADDNLRALITRNESYHHLLDGLPSSGSTDGSRG